MCLIVNTAVESVWSGVVSGTQAAVLPAHRPQFQPVPLLHAMSNVDVRPQTPPSKHSQSPSSSSSHLSREGVVSEQDRTGNISDARHPCTALHCAAADSTLQREESSDSGGVFLTPTSCSHAGPNLDSEPSTVCINSRSPSADLPLTSLVNVGRSFGKLGDNVDMENDAKDSAAGLSQNSLSGDFQTVSDTAEQPANDISDARQARRSSSCCYGVLYHRSDEPFVTPTNTKKKTKKSRRSSQGLTSCSTAKKSMAVYGGNPKWIWKS